MNEELFIYGTLRLPEIQLLIIGRKVEQIPDILKNYKITNIFIKETEYMALIPAEESEINGAVITVTKDELERVDEYESEEYRRIKVTLESGKVTWVYVKA